MLDKASIRIDIFLYSFSSMLEDNLTNYLISTTSNMLALYYASDAKLRASEPNAQKYADICSRRVKFFLKEKVVLDETLNVAMEIFAIAITPYTAQSEDLPSMNKIRNQDKISEVVATAAVGGDITEAELTLLADVIDISLEMPDASDIISLIGGQPDIIRAILNGRSRKANEIASELSKAAKNSSKCNSITSSFAQFVGLASCSLLALASNIIAVHSFAAIAAAVVIPVSVVALRYGAQIGEKLGETLVGLKSDFQNIQFEMQNILTNMIPGIDHDAQIVIQNISKKRDVEAYVNKASLDDITHNLASHIDKTSTLEQVQNIQKSLPQKQKEGREIAR